MQHISATISPDPSSYSGEGRISSPKLRASLEQAEDFLGLEENTNRYDLLLLVKRGGKAAGFSSRMIELLDYYMSFTREIDWREGHSPIVYQSLSKTALDLNMSERQIQRLEKALFEAGAVTWNDSGNHRRYGQRCHKTGEILYAYGVDLTPLAYLKADLTQKLEEKRALDQLWMQTKRKISGLRGQIRAMIAELHERGVCVVEQHDKTYQELSKPIRTHMALSDVQSLFVQHQNLLKSMTGDLEEKRAASSKITQKMSSTDDKDVAYYKSTTQEQFNKLNTASRAAPTGFQERRNGKSTTDTEPSEKKAISQERKEGGQKNDSVISETGLQHISLKQALNAASHRFRERLPLAHRPMNWADVTEAAYDLLFELNISQKSWANACVTLGRTGAAICVLLTDQASLRENDPLRSTAAYFNGMIQRAGTQELNLHKSIFGLLKREIFVDASTKADCSSLSNA